jgi:hypothetical protein
MRLRVPGNRAESPPPFPSMSAYGNQPAPGADRFGETEIGEQIRRRRRFFDGCRLIILS